MNFTPKTTMWTREGEVSKTQIEQQKLYEDHIHKSMKKLAELQGRQALYQKLDTF